MSGGDTPARSLGGRFAEATDAILHRVNRSVDVDRRLWREDIEGSKAHSAMLCEVGLLSVADRDAIHRGLDTVHAEFDAGTFVFEDADEDIHMAVERRLGALIGEPARRLHTGRSRNDQVMTDTVLWLRRRVSSLAQDVRAYVDALLARAEEGLDVVMPSFTHSQPAQVSSVAQWMLAHADEAADHVRRLDDLAARLDACPLGSGASAGSFLPLDRAQTASALGFARSSTNSIASTGSRMPLLDAVAAATMLGVSLSRLGEELVWWSSPQFGWIQLPDRLTTGSSLLPHKRNPDGAELIRGAGKIAAADFAALAATMAALPGGYSKDLQHDKAILFRAMDGVADALVLAVSHVQALSWNAEALRAACVPQLAALWLADRLVVAGMAFREAHHLVGAVVREAGAGSLAEGLEIVVRSHEVPDADAILGELRALTPEAMLHGLQTAGSAAPSAARAQIADIRSRVAVR